MRKFRLGLLMLAGSLLLGASLPPAGTGSGEARELAVSLAWNGETGDLGALTDGKASTKLAVARGDKLVLSSDEPIHGVYLIFDQPTDRYEVSAPGRAAAVETGFLHQWVPLAEPALEVTVELPENKLCEASAWGEGEPPADRVQQWLPPWEDCDLLLLPTHADDDQLWFGAAMAAAVNAGKKVQAAYLTHHWGEPYRPHELLNGLWQSGVRAYPVMGELPDYYSESLDHAKTLYDVEAAQAWMVRQLRRFRPEVVIGHDLEGEYGHGVHRLNAWLLTEALEVSGDPAAYPDSAAEFGAFDVPKTYLHLYPENKLTLAIDTPFENLGGRTAFEAAQDGYACHVSQQQYWFKVFRTGKYSCADFGLYRSTVGPDSGAGDFFEHIDSYSDEPPPEPEPSSEPPSSAPASSAAEPVVSSGPEAQPSEPVGGIRGILPAALLLGGLALAVLVLAAVLLRNRRK